MDIADNDTGLPPGYRILLVEDDALLATVASGQLEAIGCRVVHVSASAEDAIRWIDAGGAVDLVLSDIVMAGMNGVALAVYLGEHHPQIRVLLTTGYGADLLDEQKRDYPVIGKPWRGAEIAAAIRGAVAEPVMRG